MIRAKKPKTPKVSTVVGHGTSIVGDLTFTAGLHLDGNITGNVTGEDESNATLTVSEKGVIEGDVRVETLVLNGKVVGDVYASERCELASDARVTGTVYYKVLEMAAGAEVNGQLVHREEPDQRMIGYDKTKSEQANTEKTAGE